MALDAPEKSPSLAGGFGPVSAVVGPARARRDGAAISTARTVAPRLERVVPAAWPWPALRGPPGNDCARKLQKETPLVGELPVGMAWAGAAWAGTAWADTRRS